LPGSAVIGLDLSLPLNLRVVGSIPTRLTRRSVEKQPLLAREAERLDGVPVGDEALGVVVEEVRRASMHLRNGGAATFSTGYIELLWRTH
jgi:hypothetical protein